MGIHKFFNIHSNKWEVEFRGQRWSFIEEEKADELVAYLKRKYIVGGSI